MFHVEHHKKISSLFVVGARAIGCSLSDQQISSLTTYFYLLWEWKKKVNLTGLKTPEEIIGALFIDSIAPYHAFLESQVDSILDVGSGAGFPGLPLKIMLPDVRVTLLEPQLKKAAFLDYTVGTLGLHMVTVLPERIEQLNTDALSQKVSAITCKALSPLSVLPAAPRLLKESGKLYFWRAKQFEKENRLSGMEIDREISYELPFGQGKRILSILKLAR